MATIDDIGVPGQPLNTPPLTAWQAAVRDAINGLSAGGGGSTTILSGTATPGSGTGSIGNYYLDTDDRILYGPKAAPVTPPTQSAYTTQTPTGFLDAANFSYGNEFRFATAGYVVGLRYYRYATGNIGTSKNLSLYSSTGVLLGSVATVGDSGEGWMTALFPTPIQVSGAAVQMRAAVSGTPAITDRYSRSANPATDLVNGDVTMLKQGYSSASAGYPTTTSTNSYFVDVLFQTGLATSAWPVALRSVPPGGTTGQYLKKTSNADYAVGWVT